MISWLDIDPESGFSLQNLPYCVFSTGRDGPRIGVAVGDYVVDMSNLLETGVFQHIKSDLSSLKESTLNTYASLPKTVHSQIRSTLQELFKKDTTLGSFLRDDHQRRESILIPHQQARFHLPMVIGDYTDFFVTYHHAAAVSSSIADANPLLTGTVSKAFPWGWRFESELSQPSSSLPWSSVFRGNF